MNDLEATAVLRLEVTGPHAAASDGAGGWRRWLDGSRRADGTGIRAIPDAFDRIRYHRIAMVSGHRAAFEQMVREFQPEAPKAEFEGVGQGGAIARLLPSMERGQFWKPYVRKYRALWSDAKDADRGPFRDPFAGAREPAVAERHGLAPQRQKDGRY